MSAPLDDAWRPLRVVGREHVGPGKLIVIEGVDGVGKTTVLDWVATQCGKAGIEHLFTRTPTQELRDYPPWRAWYDESLGMPREMIDGFGLSLMALGDRLVHQRRILAPALARGCVVLCDRYMVSSLVHESSRIHQEVLARLVEPDAKILLTAEEEVILARLSARTYEALHPDDRAQKAELLRRYERLAEVNGYDVVRTDVAPDETLARVGTFINRLLGTAI